MKTISFQGELSALALADVVQNLAANRKTGTLRVLHDDKEHRVQIAEGKLVAYGDSTNFSMARWLGEKQLVEPAQLNEALRRFRKAKRKSLGAILKDLNALALDDYERHVRELFSETLYEVLSFKTGSFEFHEGELDNADVELETRTLGIELTAQSVIMEAARRMDDWQNVRSHLPSENEIYHVPPAQRARILEQAEDEIIADAVELLDGSLTIEQVISRLPYSRFEACRCVSKLVAAKKLQLVKGSDVIEQRQRKVADPRQEIVCLKAILDREPNNREVLSRLASLHEELGEAPESVTYNKLLAISYSEEGDLVNAEKRLRQALKLNPRDIATWRKLWKVIRHVGDREKMAKFGTQYTTHFKRLGLMEIARDQLKEMTKLFPTEAKYKIELADVQFAVGDKKACVQGLFELARDLLSKQQLPEAETVFGRILKYDRNNQKAREYYEKLRSGVLARRKDFRQRFVRRTMVALFLTALLGFFAYDLFARTMFSQVTMDLISKDVLAERDYETAVARVEEVRQTHRFSLAAHLEGRVILEVLNSKRSESAERERGKTAGATGAAEHDPEDTETAGTGAEN
jgi:tetratricopeptide (TPR) repeat protein